MNSRIGVSASSRPRPRTTRWSAKEAVSFIRWLETSTVRPSRASRRINSRIQMMPSGSSPFDGSSSRTTGGSPSSAAAMPSRWRMPREYVLTRRRATEASPASSSTSSTRRSGRRLLAASTRRWSRAVREPCAACASSRAPTWRSGSSSVAYARPPRVAVPDVGRSRPSTSRMVVDFPAPLGPRNPVTRPGTTLKVSRSTARVVPYSLVRSWTSMLVMPQGWLPGGVLGLPRPGRSSPPRGGGSLSVAAGTMTEWPACCAR